MFDYFLSGIEAILLPYGLVHLVLFCFVLSRYCFTRVQFILGAIFFALLTLLVEIFLILGVFDFFLINHGVVSLGKGLYFLTAIICIHYGCLHLYDWWRMKAQKGSFRFLIPSFSAPQGELSKYLQSPLTGTRRWWWVVIVIVLVSLSVFFSGIWASNIIFELFSYLISSGDVKVVNYTAAFVSGKMLVLGAVFAILWVLRSIKYNLVLVSLLKIVISGVLISLGLGLVILYFLVR